MNKSSAELKRFSRILLCTNLADLSYTLCAFLVDWRSSFRGGIYFSIVNGLLPRVFDIPLGWKFTLLMINGYVLHVMIALLAVPFVYRYLTVCRQVTMSNMKFAALVGFALVIPLLQPLNSYYRFWNSLLRTMEEQKSALDATLCADLGQLPLYAVSEAKSLGAMMSKYIAMSTTLASYAVIVTCGGCIYRHTRYATMSHHVRRAHRQLTLVFALEALSSLILMLLPQTRSVIRDWLARDDPAYVYFSQSYTAALIPLFNAMYSILFIRCYRITVFAAVRSLAAMVIGSRADSVTSIFSLSTA